MSIDKSFKFYGFSYLDYYEHLSDTKLKRYQNGGGWASVFSECLPLNGTYTLIFINHQQALWNWFGIRLWDEDDKRYYIYCDVKERRVYVK